MALIVDPLRKFEIKGQVCTVLSVTQSFGIANNQQVVAALTSPNQRIRVIGGWLQTNGGAGPGTVSFKSASGGTIKFWATPPQAGMLLPQVDTMYFETTEGQGLFVDVTVTAQYINLNYITYIP